MCFSNCFTLFRPLYHIVPSFSLSEGNWISSIILGERLACLQWQMPPGALSLIPVLDSDNVGSGYQAGTSRKVAATCISMFSFNITVLWYVLWRYSPEAVLGSGSTGGPLASCGPLGTLVWGKEERPWVHALTQTVQSCLKSCCCKWISMKVISLKWKWRKLLVYLQKKLVPSNGHFPVAMQVKGIETFMLFVMYIK